MTSLWQQHNIENIVIKILRDVEDNGHHLGRPFLTAYQLAIEFDRNNHSVVTQLGLEVGGAGIGEHTSLAQYLARELSGYIRENDNYPIEGAFLSNKHVKELSYTHGKDKKAIVSSLTGTGYSLSMFRLRR